MIVGYSLDTGGLFVENVKGERYRHGGKQLGKREEARRILRQRGTVGTPEGESHETNGSHVPTMTGGGGVPRPEDLDPEAEWRVPPDAGASYLGAYTLRNEWAVWLLKNVRHRWSDGVRRRAAGTNSRGSAGRR